MAYETLESIRFTNTRMKTNKQNILPKDSEGYSTVIVGGLGLKNGANEYYTAKKVTDLFNRSSALQRRVSKGVLKGELGHPKFLKGMTAQDYINRIINIDDQNVCVHFKEVWLDPNSIKDINGNPVIAIMAKAIPSGIHGHVLERTLNNPSENVCFSVRGLTKDYYERGTTVRELTTIATFDFVVEGGIAIAEKYGNPSLESFDERVITKNEFMHYMSNNNNNKIKNVATESSIELANVICDSMGWTMPAGAVPVYHDW